MEKISENKEKYKILLEEAKSHFKIADHMSYVTLVILKDNRLMIKILHELSESAEALIKSLIYYENFNKRIPIYKDPEMNLKVFKEKVAKKYITTFELDNLMKIIEIDRKRRESQMEFIKRTRFVFLSGTKYEVVDLAKIKEIIALMRTTLLKINFEKR